MTQIIPVYEGKQRVDGLYRCCNELHYTLNRFEISKCPICGKEMLMSNQLTKPKKYGLKINYELFEVFKEYLSDHPELGYRSIAEFLNEILRNKAKEILENKEKLEKQN